jgi:hypothetical protein
MITYIYKYHEYSWFPHWYTAHSSSFSNKTHQLIRNKNQIQQWCKNISMDVKIDKKGYNYRFTKQSDLTMFLLRWM